MTEEHKPLRVLTQREKLDLLWEAYELGRDRALFRKEIWADRRRVLLAFAWIVGLSGGLLGVVNAIRTILGQH